MKPTLFKDVFKFLRDLEKNNNRDWFNEHKQTFKIVEKEVKDFYNHVLELLKTHDDVDKLKMFRIYRDIRFSKDKTPCKTHFGGSFHRIKPELRGGYYLHIDPKDTFIACGFWEPHKDDLFRIRKEFEIDDTEIRKIINDKKFVETFGELKGDEVKTAPKGFNKNHAAIDLIKKKQYIFIKRFSIEEALSSDFAENINDTYKIIRPYFDYMSEVLTTDLNGVSLI